MGRKAALITVLSTLIAFALVPSASANWTHKGKGELKENASVTLSGELTLSTSAGNVSCPVAMGTTLTASSSAGHVNSFTVSKPSKCDLTGSLAVEEEEPEGEIESFAVANPAECDLGGAYKTSCGTNAVAKVEQTGTATLTATESKGEAIGAASAGGSASASPSGTFQLTEDTGHQAHTEETAETAETTATKTEGPVQLTDENGELIEKGSEVTLKSTNMVTTVASTAILCEAVILHFEVESNFEHVVLQPVESPFTTTGCKLSVGGGVFLPTVFTSPSITELTFDTWGRAETPTTFKIDIFPMGLTNCHYEGTFSFQGTGYGLDVLALEPSNLVGSGAGCFPSMTAEAEFTLQDPEGNPVFLDFAETEE